MDGTRYVDGVLVDTSQLSRTENSKAFHILLDRRDNWETGINTGLKITVNPVNTSRVDISAGTGYAINGEYVEVQADQLNVQLADNTLGATNYVFAFYTELKTSPNPHETNGTVQPTENERSFRLRILTAAQFSALPLTDPTYSTDAQDRALLIGIVTATGGALTSSNISQPADWRSLKYAAMAVPALSGVVVTHVSDTTPEGNSGLLKYETGPARLAWQAPTEVGFGAAVNIISDGTYTLTAIGGSTIQVSVTVASLPTVATQVIVSIYGLYTQSVPRMSSTDRHHRSLIGSGVPSPSNPHGLSIDDISPGFATDLLTHQQLMHANGIWRGSSSSCLAVSIDESTNPDRLLITSPVGSDCYWVYGKRLTAVNNTVLTFSGTVSTKKSVLEVFVDNVGNVKSTIRAEQVGVTFAGADNGLIFLNDEVAAGNHTLTWTVLTVGGGGYLSWDGGKTPVKVPANGTGAFLLRNGKQEVWVYIASFSALPTAVGVYDNVVTVYAAPIRTENLPLAHVFYGGDSVGSLGYTNLRGTNAALLVDLRQFGTLLDYHLRDDALKNITELPTDEHHASGVAIGRFDFHGAFGSLWPEKPTTGLAVPLWGQAPVYVKGRRFLVGSYTSPLSVAVPDNAATVIYVDNEGKVAQAPLIQCAYLFTNQPNAFDSAKVNKTLSASYTNQPYVFVGAPLALVISSGGNVTRVIDMRRNLSGGNVNIRPWTVGANAPVGGTPTTAQAAEFYSLDTALLYAAFQGQEKIDCIDAVLSPGTTPPYAIPADTQITLSGRIWLTGDWSTSAAVFALSSGASLALENAQIDKSNFTGSANLALIAAYSASAPSDVVIENSSVAWSGCGHVVTFTNTLLLGSTLQVDGLICSTSGGTPPAIFNLASGMDMITIDRVRILSGLAPLIAAEESVTASVSDCRGGGGVFATVANSKALRGTFSGVTNFSNIMTGLGSIAAARWSNCSFGSVDVPLISTSTFASCAFSSNLVLGSVATPATSIILTGCQVQSDATIYGHTVEVTSCEVGQRLLFGGNHFKILGSTVTSSVIHQNLASDDVKFSACSMSSFDHTNEPDLTNWSLNQCTVGRVQVLWTTEAVSVFSIVNCTIETALIVKPATVQTTRALYGTISNCLLNFASGAGNLWLSGCSHVQVTNNQFIGLASQAMPMILLGNDGHTLQSQGFRDIQIMGNSFTVASVIASALPPAIILVSDDVATSNPISLVISENKFIWRPAAPVTSADQVLCVMYVNALIQQLRLSGNTMHGPDGQVAVAWDTATGAKNRLNMGLFVGYSSVSPVTHTAVLSECTIQGNLNYTGAAAVEPWLLVDVGIGSPVLAIGNFGGDLMSAYPAPAAPLNALPFNTTVDNA